MSTEQPEIEEIISETDDLIDINIGISEWVTEDKRYILEEDFKVSGEVWRVHLTDADPYPSKPHAHCIGGSKRFIGCKLHLGTAELYDSKNKPLKRFLYSTQFDRLIELVKKKFPQATFPITV